MTRRPPADLKEWEARVARRRMLLAPICIRAYGHHCWGGCSFEHKSREKAGERGDRVLSARKAAQS